MQNFDHNIGFWEKRQFFRQKLSKIAENWDHNIDSRKLWVLFKPIAFLLDWVHIRVIVNAGQFFDNYKNCLKCRATYSHGKSYDKTVDKKWVGLHFGRLLKILIWSPWSIFTTVGIKKKFFQRETNLEGQQVYLKKEGPIVSELIEYNPAFSISF
jgi:hypothetical protein